MSEQLRGGVVTGSSFWFSPLEIRALAGVECERCGATPTLLTPQMVCYSADDCPQIRVVKERLWETR